MNLKDKQIAIIGGGPGGLTLARLLQQGGCKVTVYERDLNKNARVQGANLDLHEESGLAALRKAGLMAAFYANHLPDAGKLRITDHHGTICLDDHQEGSISENRPEIDRGPLRKILLESLQNDTVVWDSRFLSMEKANDGWRLHFHNKENVYADIVIGADGANSKIRPYLSAIKPVYSGVTIVEGNIYEAEKSTPKLFNLLKGGKLFALGNEQSLILSTKGDGSIAFYTGEKVDENWVTESNINFKNIPEVKNWFVKSFPDWDLMWHELFTAEKISIIPRPLFHYPSSQHWEPQSNLTIIGDAAHRMPPYAGEGVNMAMLDALELSEILLDDKSGDTKAAFSAYETKMLKRAAEVTAMTMVNTVALHSSDALQYILEMFRSFDQQA